MEKKPIISKLIKGFSVVMIVGMMVCLTLTKGHCSKPPMQSQMITTTTLTALGSADYSYRKLVNLNAPKGGMLRLATVGTFDSLNPLSLFGLPIQYMNITYESLMYRSPVEPFTLYCLIAQKVEVSPDKSRIIFYLRHDVKFHDGTPLTTADIQATLETLKEKGLPRYKNLYKKIKSIKIKDDYTIEFEFNPMEGVTPIQYNPEVPMSLALVPIFSKHQLASLDFSNSALTPLMGTGPYQVDTVDPGRIITFKRNANYWGATVDINLGRFNFDNISIEYFKNSNALFQGFFANLYDVYFETNPYQWKHGYNLKAVKSGNVVKVNMQHNRPVLVRNMIMNARRPLFKDIELRRALVLAFDAYTYNKMIFGGDMQVPHSLFANTELAHQGPAVGEELIKLQKYQSQLPPAVYDRTISTAFTPAFTRGNGDHRQNLIEAANILDAAGYKMVKGKRMTKEGKPLVISFMIKDDKVEKIALYYRENLKRLGIKLFIRKCDPNAYEKHVMDFDFDIILHHWANSLSPSTEQIYFFGQKYAYVKGASNYIGIDDPVAEGLATDLSAVQTRHDQVIAAHALDRYIMHQCYQIPVSYDNTLRFAYWKDKVDFPQLEADKDMDIMTRGWAKINHTPTP